MSAPGSDPWPFAEGLASITITSILAPGAAKVVAARKACVASRVAFQPIAKCSIERGLCPLGRISTGRPDANKMLSMVSRRIGGCS